MKTDDLIKALGADTATRQPTVAEQAMWALPIATWIAFGIWGALGLVVYFGYSIRKSKLRVQAG